MKVSGAGRGGDGAERSGLASGRKAQQFTAPRPRGQYSPRRGSWSFEETLGWEGCSGWNCWKLWNASENQSPGRPKGDSTEKRGRRASGDHRSPPATLTQWPDVTFLLSG